MKTLMPLLGKPASAACLILLVLSGCRDSGVGVHEERLILPFDARETYVVGSHPVEPKRRTVTKRLGRMAFESIVLENEYLRVRTIPKLAGQVYEAVYKPTGDDLFYREERSKAIFAYVQSGVRASFPRSEHGMFFFGQPASWRVMRREDGSVTLAMWMEFSRHNFDDPEGNPRNFTRVMLSQHVTLRPREALFSVTYRLVNPSPYRIGRQCWNDAFFPRNQTRDGVVHGWADPPEQTKTEWIYPASYVSFHGGRDRRLYAESEKRIGESTRPDNSVFAWSMPFGFAGLWYPDVEVSRLRLWDAAVAPGAKQYFRGEGAPRDSVWGAILFNLIELWGGTDCLFEGVENWLGPGEAWEFTHRFALVRGIGKVDYADERLAVNVEFEGPDPCVEVVAFQPVRRLAATLDGRPLGRAAPCAPDRPAVFPIPAGVSSGRLVLVADGGTILDRAFPLKIPANTERDALIKQAVDHTRPATHEMAPGSSRWRTYYRRALEGYREGSVEYGRILYRDGQLDLAVECLTQATRSAPDDGAGWHLLGASLLESGRHAAATDAFCRAVSAARPYPPARYFLALDALAQDDRAEAAEHLERLCQERPAHWEGRLLLAWIEAIGLRASADSLATAQSMERQDPADPRLLYVLWKGAEKLGDVKRAAAAKAVLERGLRTEPGAERRLKEFQAATRGEYLPPFRPEQKPLPRQLNRRENWWAP